MSQLIPCPDCGGQRNAPCEKCLGAGQIHIKTNHVDPDKRALQFVFKHEAPEHELPEDTHWGSFMEMYLKPAIN